MKLPTRAFWSFFAVLFLGLPVVEAVSDAGDLRVVWRMTAAVAESRDLSGMRSSVARMEEAVFGRVSSSPSLSERIGALEKAVFGRSSTGTLVARTDRLVKTVGLASSKMLPPIAPRLDNGTRPPLPAPRSGTAVAARMTETRARLVSGIKLYQDGKVEEAERVFQEVLRLQPGDADASFSLGAILESRGDFAGALGYYQAAARANPKDRESLQAASAMEEKLAAAGQGPFANPLDGRPGYLQARAIDIQALDSQAPGVALPQLGHSPRTPFGTAYIGSPGGASPPSGIGQRPSPPGSQPKSAGASFARGFARVAATTALQCTGLHCPLCQILRGF